MPGRSRVVIPIHRFAVRQERVAVEVHADVGQVVASQTLEFGTRCGQPGVATALGALAPSSSWWFTDGKAIPDSDQRVAITDLGVIDAQVVVQALIGSNGHRATRCSSPSRRADVSWVQIGGCARSDKNCLAVPTNIGYELTVQSDAQVPIVAQTLSRFSDTGTALGATTSMGSTTPARRWVIAADACPSTRESTSIAW